MLVDMVFAVQETEEFRCYLASQLDHNCYRNKSDLLKLKGELELEHAKKLEVLDGKIAV